MERFTEREIDLWHQWMTEEFTHGVDNHGGVNAHAGSVELLKRGVTRAPHDPWSGQASRYMREAVMAGPVLQERGTLPSGVGLKVTRAFGKCAQNNLACLAYGIVVFEGLEPEDVDYEAVLLGLTRSLGDLEIDSISQPYLELDERLEDFSRRQYEELQILQSSGNSGMFRHKLTSVAMVNSAGFIACTREWGWPTPGVSSTEDPTLWV